MKAQRYNWTATGMAPRPTNQFGVVQYVRAPDHENLEEQRDKLAAALRKLLASNDGFGNTKPEDEAAAYELLNSIDD